MTNEESTHEQLMQLFRTYFIENQTWSRQKTHAAGIRARKALADIRILARKRRAEIQIIRAAKPKNTTPAYIEANRRKAELKKNSEK